jgi:hypothetical protein
MTNMIGTSSENAAKPMYGVSWVRICSAPYAEDEMQSGDRTPRATGLEIRSPASCSETNGRPRKTLFNR